MAAGAAGAIGMWAAAARKQAREMACRAEGRRAIRREQRHARQAAPLGSAASQLALPPAATLCMTCGVLVPPAFGGDPMRAAPHTPVGPSSACGHCGARTWLALGEAHTAEALCELEQREVASRRGRVIAGLVLAGAVVSTVAIAIASVLAYQLVALNLFGAMLLAVAATRWIGRDRAVARVAFRWRAPTLRPRIGPVVARGSLAANGSTCSPIGRREGIAWRVEVRRVGEPAGRLALVEQRCLAASVDGHPIGAEPVIAIPGTLHDDAPPHVAEYLRSRGIDPHGALEIREVVLCAGDRVTLCLGRSGPPVLRGPG